MIWLFAAILVLVCAVNFVEFVPLIIFLSYLIYGLLRPWISQRWQREIEIGAELEFEPEIFGDPDDNEAS
jgi:CDP-diacylglycerol--serine O-phosphatidyltransferase